MPDKVTNELIYEILKTMQGDLSVLRDDMADVKSRRFPGDAESY